MKFDEEFEVRPFRAVACSGASNAGNIADKCTRKLAESGIVDMDCLTKIAIRNQVIINNYMGAQGRIAAIDGCSIECAKKILESAGISDFKSVVLTEFGVEKGITPVNDIEIERIASIIESIIKK